MAKTQLKLLLFLIVLGITLGCMATAYYIYAKVLSPEKTIQAEMKGIKKTELPAFDPGAKRFDAAVELLKEGKTNEARDALLKLVKTFPDSAKCTEAKRIVGEINLDEFFSANEKAGKKDYIVQPGDSLLGIAGKHGTNMDMLIRLNGLVGSTLQPGEHLTIVPAEFSVAVDVSEKKVVLLRKIGDVQTFFKEYHAVDVQLPPGMRPPVEMEIKGKASSVTGSDGKPVLPTDPRWIQAEHWLPGSKYGMVLRTPPAKKAAPAAPAPVVAVAVPESGEKGGKTQGAPGGESLPMPPPLPATPDPGVFLTRPDLEELFALLRNGSKLSFVR